LGGLDALVFTAESAKTRLLELLPVKPLNFWGSGSTQKKCLLAYCSRHQHGEFSGKGLVIHTQEDWAIAQACWHLGMGGRA